MQSNEEYEEEMVRLASDISLMEESDLHWNPCNLDEGREKIKIIENIVDEHLISDNNINTDGVDSEPISSAQIRDIFGINDNKTVQKGSLPQLSSNSNLRERDSTDSFDRYSMFSQGGCDTPSGRKEISKDTIISIRWKLKWYQKHIVNQIEETHEVYKIYYLSCLLLLI